MVRLAIAERILGVQAELEAKNARLEEMAKLDPLTGLANRRRLAEGIEAVLSGGHVAAPLSVLAIDVDHFKSYNDEFGHSAGDEVLRMIAATLRANTRAGDLVARYGGEEFIVLLPGVDTAVAGKIAESLRAAIESRDDAAPAHLGVASALLAQKKYEAASDALAEYLKLDPGDKSAHFDRASALLNLSRFDDAWRCMAKR